MQEWEEKIINKRKAREEGLAEGRVKGLAEGRAEGITIGQGEGRYQLLQEQIKKKLEKGYISEEIADFLEADVETVRKIAAEIQTED